MVTRKSNNSQTIFLNGSGSSTSTATDTILSQYPATKGISTYPSNIPCPICNQISKDCRYQNETKYRNVAHYCQTNSDARRGQIINGYRCVKESNGHTALFLVSQTTSSIDPTIPPKPKASIDPTIPPKPKAKPSPQGFTSEMSAEEKDLNYRELLDEPELSLRPEDKERLSARGYTEAQIEGQLFRSATKYYKPRFKPPQNLPGLTQDGKLTIAVSRVIIIPTFDLEKRIVALRYEDLYPEIKPDGKKTGKYRAISNKDNSSNILGEQPIETYFPEGEHKTIYIPEAGGHKLRLASFLLDIPCIGGVGGVLRNCPKQLKERLKKAREKYGNDLSYVIVPDGGDCFNPRVRDRIKKEVKNLRDFGIEAKILWWKQTEKKGTPDIDELSSEQFEQAQEISLTEFLKIGEEAVKEEEKQIANEQLQELANSRKFTPHYTVILKDGEYFNLEDFILKNNIDIRGKILAIKADTGVGKTRAILDYLKISKLLFLFLTPTNNLGYSILGECLSLILAAKHIKDDGVDPRDPELNFISCLEQSFNLVGTVGGRVVIIDEPCPVLRTTASGGTVSDSELGQHRLRSELIFSNCASLILLDEALSNKTCDFYQQLSDDKELIKIEIKREKPKVKKITFLDSVKIDPNGGEKIVSGDTSILKSELLEHEKTVVVTDSKTIAKFLEELLTKEGKKVKVIHGDNSHLPEIQNAIRNINEYIDKERPDVLILSPTCAQGVSITVKYFMACYGVFVGVLGTEAQYQMLNRCRDNEIPYFVICPERSRIPTKPVFSVEDRDEDIRFQASLRTWNEWEEKQEKAKARRDWRWESLVDEYIDIEIIEKLHCRDNLEYYLQQRGHTVTTEERNHDNQSALEIKEIKEEIALKEDTLTFNSPVVPLDEAREQHKKNPTLESRATLKKARIMHDYPDIENQDFWKVPFITATRKQKDYLQCVKMRYYFDNFEEYRSLDTYQKTKAFDREITTTKELSRSDIATVQHSMDSGIQALLDGSEFSHRDERVTDIYSSLRENRSASIQLLKKQRIPKNPDSRTLIEVIKKIAAIIGFKLEFTRKKKLEDGGEVRHYKLVRVHLKDLDESVTDFLYQAIGKKIKSDIADYESGFTPKDEEEGRFKPLATNVGTGSDKEPDRRREPDEELDRDKVLDMLDLPGNLKDYLYPFGDVAYREFKVSCNFTLEELEKLEAAKNYERSMINLF